MSADLKNYNIIDSSGMVIKIAGHPYNWLINNYGLPLHIVDKIIIQKNLRSFKNVFNQYYPNGLVCFAAKACTHPEIFKIVVSEDCGSDVASENELKCAIDSGMNTGKIILNGNSKEDSLIENAISNDIVIAADSIEEFKIINSIAGKLNKNARVILRISGFELGNVTSKSIFTAGKWSKFGVDIIQLPDFFSILKNSDMIDFQGFHVHIGSQITEVEPYLSVLGKLVELGKELINIGVECKILNIGGGYPVSYVNESDWMKTLDKIRTGIESAKAGDTSKIYVWDNGSAGFKIMTDGTLNLEIWKGEKYYTKFPKEKMLEEIFKSNILVNGKSYNSIEALKQLNSPLLIIEPGRSIIDDAGVTLAKVGFVRKIQNDHNLITLEMGITSHGIALLDIPINRWLLVNEHNKKDSEAFETFVCGNLCFSGDMISKYKVVLQRKPERGDIVMIRDTGAYTSSFFASNPNSFPRPARLLINENGNIIPIFERESYSDIFPGKKNNKLKGCSAS